jgi:hypothetical protein
VKAQELGFVLGKCAFVLLYTYLECGMDVPSIKSGIIRRPAAVSQGIVRAVSEGHLGVLFTFYDGRAQVLVTLDQQKVLLVSEIVKLLLLMK